MCLTNSITGIVHMLYAAGKKCILIHISIMGAEPTKHPWERPS